MKTAARQALGLAVAFAATKLVLQTAATWVGERAGFGIFRDELYYVMCGRLLDFGYVDHAPLVAVQAKLASGLFGTWLPGLRLFSALAGASTVMLAGLLAWSFGGSRLAQALAMVAALLNPMALSLDSYLSMNSCEPTFWLSAVLALSLLAQGGSPRWWLLFGVAAGLGIENKPSIVVFLAMLLLGLLCTPQRRVLRSWWCLAGVGLIVVLALPFAIFQLRNGLPFLEFMRNGAAENKNVVLSPLQFIGQQVLSMNPVSALLWGAGLGFFFALEAGRPFRFAGIAFVAFFVAMILLHAKPYYLAPVYPMLFAGGACAVQQLRWRWVVPAYAALLVVSGAALLPMAVPVLPPDDFIRYQSALGIKPSETETLEQGPLPQFFSDRFGWQPLADEVTRIYRALPEAEQAKAGILVSNYGEASAINVLAAPGTPVAVSGHNSYFLWGHHGYTGEVLIVVTRRSQAELEKLCDQVERAGETKTPYSMPYEQGPIYVCRGTKKPFAEVWQTLKHFI